MALALLVYARWTRVMRFDPQDPVWPNRDVHSRVVSMPSGDIFEHQPKEYRDGVLPPAITARVAIEQASAFGWERYLGSTGSPAAAIDADDDLVRRAVETLAQRGVLNQPRPAGTR